MKKILFTSVGRRVELVQQFKAVNNTIIYGADISNTAPALQFCDKTIISPKIADREYIPFLIDYCKKEQVDLLIPTIDTDLLVLSQNKDKFGKTKVLISKEEKISICRDKRLSAKYFNDLGLNTPIPVDDYKKYNQGFPAFIKPKDGSSSIFAYKVNSQSELEAFVKQVPEYIIQPYIEGTEYTVDSFCDFDGNPIYITPRIRLAIRSGEVLKTEISQDKQIIEEIKTILKDFKACGPTTIQLIREKETNKDYFIEINPRFGGGAPLSMKAGANSAEALIKLLNGEKLEYIDNAADDGAIYSRFDQSVRIK